LTAPPRHNAWDALVIGTECRQHRIRQEERQSQGHDHASLFVHPPVDGERPKQHARDYEPGEGHYKDRHHDRQYGATDADGAEQHCRVGTERQHLTMRDIDDPHHAEDQIQAEPEQRIDAASHDAEDDEN
jgi:hypothetical protein